MQLGVMVITENDFGSIEEMKMIEWIEQEFFPLFKLKERRFCRDDVYDITNDIQGFAQVDVIIIIADLSLKKLEHTVQTIRSCLHSRIQPLEEAMKFALLMKSGPLSALNTTVAGLRDQTHVFAIPKNFVEIQTLISTIVKPYLLNHVFFDKIRLRPLEMLKEYLESEK